MAHALPVIRGTRSQEEAEPGEPTPTGQGDIPEQGT